MTDEAKTQALLDAVLEGRSKEFKQKVLDIVAKSGVRPNDPMFLLLLSTGRLEVLMEETPAALDELFHRWTQEVRRSYELVEKAAVEGQKSAIAKAARDLVRTAERQEARRFFNSLVPALGVFLATYGLGFFMGITVPPWLQGGADPSGPRKLTLAQAEALQWAESKEGKFARDLMKWNNGYLENLDCLNDVKRLNVKLVLNGRPATYGYCTIWVTPPEKRQFER